MLVCQDCCGVDLNMGCPKPFSTTGGMGAALMSEPERAASIIRAMRAALPASVAVSAKIRLRGDAASSLAIVCALAEAGCAAIAVHCRRVEEQPPAAPPRHAEQRALFSAARREHPALFGKGGSCALLANGDVYTWDDIEAAFAGGGDCDAAADGVLLGRPALLNCSVFRGPGRQLPRLEVLHDYARFALRYEVHFKNAKYVVMEMLSKRRHSRAANALINSDPMPKRVSIATIGQCRSLADIVKALGYTPPAHEIAATTATAAKSGPTTDGASKDRAVLVDDARVYDDAYFKAELEPTHDDAAAAGKETAETTNNKRPRDDDHHDRPAQSAARA